MNIGDAIRKLRLDKGATLEAVALDAGTNAGNLSRIERGVQRPTLQMVEQIARALGTSVAEIYTKAEAKKTRRGQRDDLATEDSKDTILLRRNFNELTPENRRLAVEFVKMLKRLQREAVRPGV